MLNKEVKKAAEIIKNGGLVAFPTETVYGLGASALNSIAVEKIFKIKGRPSDNPLIVHIGTEQQLELLTYPLDLISRKLVRKFWPGPLTLVLRKKEAVPDNVTARLGTVAVRMPAHETARLLAKLAGPIAAPSANKSGKPSPTSIKHILEDYTKKELTKIGAILDGEIRNMELNRRFMTLLKRILRPGTITLSRYK